MNGKLLDTNVIIKTINGSEEVARILDEIAVEEIFIPLTVYGELMYGAEKSSKKELNKKLFSEFCSIYQFVWNDISIAETYGKVKNQLKSNGVNIPENDIWIAATAISKDYELITGDNHFENIEALKLKKINLQVL